MKPILWALNAMKMLVGTMSILGIVVSLIVGAAAGAGTAIVLVAKSTAVDPACITAANVGKQMTSTLNADEAAISRDQDNPLAKQADLQHLVTDLQSMQGQMATAEAQATRPSVKAALSTIVSDLSMFSSSLLAIENGDLSQVSQVTTAASRAQSDGQAIRAACTAASPLGPGR